MEILGAVGGLVGAIAAVIAVYQSRVVRRTALQIDVDKLLDEAWDLMGGRKGATAIVVRSASQTDLEEARRRIRDARTLDESSGRVARFQGVYYWLLERQDEARESFEEAVRLSRSKYDLTAAHCNLANLQCEKDQFSEAIESYRKALEVDPDHYMLYYNLGGVYHELGHISDATAAYEASIERNPY